MSRDSRRSTDGRLPSAPRAVRGGMEVLRRAIGGPFRHVDVDFEQAGLLDGLEGEEREARRALVQMLADEGVTLEDLIQAVKEQRLALLPVERVLSGEEACYTLAELAEQAGLDARFLANVWRAFGAAVGDIDELTANDQDLQAAQTVRRWSDAGVSEEGILEIARAMRHGMSMVAGAMRSVLGASFVRAGDSELDVALRYAEVAEEAASELDWLLGYALRVHQRNQLALEVTGAEAPATGQPSDGRQMAVCFADLVGFTSLGENAYAREIASVAARLDALAAQAVRSPVQLVKTIGDAVMLVSPDVDALIDTALDLNHAVARDPTTPQLRIGIAYGPAMPRAGDWFGQPVNLASRLTALAAPGQILVTEEIRNAATKTTHDWTAHRRRRIKGLAEPLKLHSLGPEQANSKRRARARRLPSN